MEHCNEKELVKYILDGEPKAFSVLLKRYQRPLHAMIQQIITNREDAEELTQDVFVKAYTKLSSFRGESSLSTWLYRIAYNTAVSATRKKKLYYNDFNEILLNNIPDTDVNEMLDRENDEVLLKQMESAIKKLSPEERGLISLYYTQDKSVNGIAEITGLSPDNVKIRLFRVRKKIVFLINNPQS